LNYSEDRIDVSLRDLTYALVASRQQADLWNKLQLEDISRIGFQKDNNTRKMDKAKAIHSG
jgi:hypothetical protein